LSALDVIRFYLKLYSEVIESNIQIRYGGIS